jgi:hypothetical protein
VRLFVGTARGLLELADSEPVERWPEPINALARGPAGLAAVARGAAVLVSRDGRAWEPAGRLRGVLGRSALVDDGAVLVGTSGAHLVRVAGGRATRIRGFDRVPSRAAWYTPWGGPPDVRSLARDAAGARYANVHVGGILRSEDGVRWAPTAIDIDADVHQVIAHPEAPGRLLAATAVGLAESADGGASWRFDDEGLHAAYCRAVAIAGDALLLSASRGPGGREAALYRRPLAGGRFERVRAGLPTWFAGNLDTGCLDAIGDLAALGTEDGRVFVSADAGRTWEERAAGLAPVCCLVLV